MLRRVKVDREVAVEATATDPVAHARSAVEMIDVGRGSVETRRHSNPDGSRGGLVAFTAHVEPDAYVTEFAFVLDNARVFSGGRVEGEALVLDNARIREGGVIGGEAMVGGDCTVIEAVVDGAARVVGTAHIGGGAHIMGEARIGGAARVLGPAIVDGQARIKGQVWVSGGHITDQALVDGNAVVRDGAYIDGNRQIFEGTHPREGEVAERAALLVEADALDEDELVDLADDLDLEFGDEDEGALLSAADG